MLAKDIVSASRVPKGEQRGEGQEQKKDGREIEDEGEYRKKGRRGRREGGEGGRRGRKKRVKKKKGRKRRKRDENERTGGERGNTRQIRW